MSILPFKQKAGQLGPRVGDGCACESPCLQYHAESRVPSPKKFWDLRSDSFPRDAVLRSALEGLSLGLGPPQFLSPLGLR